MGDTYSPFVYLVKCSIYAEQREKKNCRYSLGQLYLVKVVVFEFSASIWTDLLYHPVHITCVCHLSNSTHLLYLIRIEVALHLVHDTCVGLLVWIKDLFL